MTRQPTRYELAAKLLAAPVLDTPLLDRLRQNPADVNRWADVPWEALSAGERVVLGWLAREVWSGYPLLVPPDIRSSSSSTRKLWVVAPGTVKSSPMPMNEASVRSLSVKPEKR